MRAQARASPPTTRATALDPSAIEERAWVTRVCWGTPISESVVRAPRAPIASATKRAGSGYDHVPWGTAIRSTAPRSERVPASSAAAFAAAAISATGSSEAEAVPTPTSTGVRPSSVTRAGRSQRRSRRGSGPPAGHGPMGCSGRHRRDATWHPEWGCAGAGRLASPRVRCPRPGWLREKNASRTSTRAATSTGSGPVPPSSSWRRFRGSPRQSPGSPAGWPTSGAPPSSRNCSDPGRRAHGDGHGSRRRPRLRLPGVHVLRTAQNEPGDGLAPCARPRRAPARCGGPGWERSGCASPADSPSP